MSRFGKKEEDQLRYKCEKLLKHIENIEQSNRLYHIITSSMLRKIGGSIDIVDEDEPKPFSIGISRNEETKTTTYIYYDMAPTDAVAIAEIADEQIKKEEI